MFSALTDARVRSVHLKVWDHDPISRRAMPLRRTSHRRQQRAPLALGERMNATGTPIHAKGLGALMVCALLACQPVAAQSSSQGWPDGDTKAAVPTAPVAKKARATTAKPAAETEQVKTTEAAKGTQPAKATDPAGDSAGSFALVQALRQQSDLLARLTVELEAQRAVILEQQQKIEALYERRDANGSASPAGATVAVPALSETNLTVPRVSSTVDTDKPSAPVTGTGPGAPTSAAVQNGDADLLKRIRHRLLSSGASTP